MNFLKGRVLVLFSLTLLVLVSFAVIVNAYPAWAPNTGYTVGTMVTYGGNDYKCIQAHTSLVGWEPPNVPALWQLIGPSGSSSPASTPTATKTPSGTVTTTKTPTASKTPTPSSSSTATKTPSSSSSPTATKTPTATVTKTPTVTATTTPVSGIVLSMNGLVLTWTDSAGGSDYHVYKNGGWLAWTSSRTYTVASAVVGDQFYVTNGGGSVKSNTVTYGGGSSSPTATATPSAGVTPTRTSTQTPPPPGSHKYVVYAGTWNTSIYDLTTANIPNYITGVNLAFAKPNTSYVKGSYAFDQLSAGFEFVEGAATNNGQKYFTAQQAQDLRNNIAALKARGTKVYVSYGGWAYSQGSEWANFNTNSVIDLAVDLGASGVDIDWEPNGDSCNKQAEPNFSCTLDSQIKGIINNLYNTIRSKGANLEISIAGWSTGAYYVAGTPFEEGKVQWGSPFGGIMYRVVKDNASQINFVNLMSYDAGAYYDPREGYESYKAIYNGPINMGMEIAPEGAGGSVLVINAQAGTVYDAEMMTGVNNDASKYYNVQTMVNYIKNKGKASDGFMLWQMWKQRVYGPAPGGAATENSAGQYVCNNLPLSGTCSQTIPNLPKLTP